MDRSPNPSQFLGEGLRFLQVCPSCETAYNPLEARILGEQNDSHLLHIQCRRCFNALLALVAVSAMGISSIGVMTDLTFDDVLKFKEAEPVTADEVLGTHVLLQNETAFFDALR